MALFGNSHIAFAAADIFSFFDKPDWLEVQAQIQIGSLRKIPVKQDSKTIKYTFYSWNLEIRLIDKYIQWYKFSISSNTDTEVNFMESIWQKTTQIGARPALEEDISAETVIIGGGLAGILTAHFLTQAGYDTVVLEAGRIGSGQTGRTTAKITAQHGLRYTELMERFGEETARAYAAANLQAVTQYRRLIDSLSIPCDFAEAPAYLYASEAPEQLENEAHTYQVLGLDGGLVQTNELPFPTAAALRLNGQAQFHPLKFLKHLAAPLRIYEHTRVSAVQDGVVTTGQGAVHAKNIIFACHFPFINHPGYYFMRMHQERSYCIAVQGVSAVEGMYLGVDGDQLSFRQAGGCVLLGGGGHRTGENRKGGQFAMLEERARQFWPGCKITARWSAQDCIPMDGIPYIGRFSSDTPDWFVATGFQKWGMTSAMAAARILTAQVQGETPEFETLFSPQRFQPSASAGELFRNMAEAVRGVSRTAFGLPRAEADALPFGHGGIVSVHGEKLGVYKAPNGEIFAIDPRCPHMGCQLEWNPDTLSWECPCHGSRFDYRGRLLDGPAQTGLTREKG